MHKDSRFALVSLAAMAVITIAWWALALWPVPAEAPAWLVRTRYVCFGVSESGLPDPAGWAILIGQPVSMLAVLLFGWGRAAREGLFSLARSTAGRATLTAFTLIVVTAAVAGTVRVAGAMGTDQVLLEAPARPAAEQPRLDRRAPGLELVDQSGQRFSLDHHRGRPVLVTFAFGHCETVCPVLVREVLAAQRLADDEGLGRPAVVIVTVDPWRDSPARLPRLARAWELPPDAHVLSGALAEVLRALESWEVSVSRDPRTGDVIHPAVVYVLDRAGRIAFAATGGGRYAVELVARL